MKKFGLAWQILIGLILGIIWGALFYGNPSVERFLEPIGTIFIRLLKMIVVPIVITSIVVGVAGAGDIKKVGKLGGKTFIYFEIITTFAILIGLAAANIFQPGIGVHLDSLAKGDISSYLSTTKDVESHSLADTFINIVPQNIFTSLSEGNMLAIIFFSVMFGLGTAAMGERGQPVFQFFQAASEAMFNMTSYIMKLAPIGVFALIGVTVSKFGVSSLIPLSKLIIVVYLTMIVFVLVILGLTAKLVKFNIFSLLKILKDELALAFSTASSEAVMPRIIEKMEKFGCPKGITSFVVPTGYSFNLDGSSIYQSITAIFIAQMYGIHMSVTQQISLVLVLMVTSKGIAGVPGVSLVVLLATLGSVGIPIEGVAFVAGIDRILDMARTTVNVVGNSLAAIVISKWEGQYDLQKGIKYLASIEEKK
ncbi:proton glutamate symport protein [Bacillus sp. OV322]|uniref:cation:dicarboxylate symporter family transporter n=1 Tax=Bacillus sp. OV322 TaxID=1882764 RepID=UPI0008EDD6FE|nr:cation:dicarboxylase symporter family transporter [Bacillus sp. OV322]SFB93235.1 proton glutamate symport protein [Bacillus sp. OV322]